MIEYKLNRKTLYLTNLKITLLVSQISLTHSNFVTLNSIFSKPRHFIHFSHTHTHTHTVTLCDTQCQLSVTSLNNANKSSHRHSFSYRLTSSKSDIKPVRLRFIAPAIHIITAKQDQRQKVLKISLFMKNLQAPETAKICGLKSSSSLNPLKNFK